MRSLVFTSIRFCSCYQPNRVTLASSHKKVYLFVLVYLDPPKSKYATNFNVVSKIEEYKMKNKKCTKKVDISNTCNSIGRLGT